MNTALLCLGLAVATATVGIQDGSRAGPPGDRAGEAIRVGASGVEGGVPTPVDPADADAAALLTVESLRPGTEGSGTCSTPRRAVAILLEALQPESYAPQRAALCLNRATLSSAREASERAEQIKAVLDSRGLYVELSAVPDRPDYVNELEQARYRLFATAPDLYLQKVGDRWLWSRHTVDVIPQLYEQTFLLDINALTQHLPGWMLEPFLGLKGWKWLALAVVLLASFVVRRMVGRVVASQGRRLMRRLGVVWGEELLARGARPIGILAGAWVVTVLTPPLRLPVRLSQLIMVTAQTVMAIAAVWALVRLVDLFSAWLEERSKRTDTKLDDQLVPLIRRALKMFAVAVGSIFVLQNLNIDVTGLVAGFGVGGVAVALAAKDTIANLFGSATIFGSRVFQIGDWVTVDGAEGIVESVGFRATKIRTFYNSLVTIPNAKVADAAVDNYGARRYRRCRTIVGLTYDTTPEQMQAFVEGTRAIIQANPYTRKDYYEVHFHNFGASSLDVLLYFFFEVPSWSEELRQRHNVLLEVIRLAKALGVSFAFPTQTLHLDTVAKETPMEHAAIKNPAELAAAATAFGPEGEMARPQGPRITHGYLAS